MTPRYTFSAPSPLQGFQHFGGGPDASATATSGPASPRAHGIQPSRDSVLRGFARPLPLPVLLLSPEPRAAVKKRGVEGTIGRFHPHHMVPVPRVFLQRWAERGGGQERPSRHARHIDHSCDVCRRTCTLKRLLQSEQPDHPFEAGPLLRPRVDGKTRTCIRQFVIWCRCAIRHAHHRGDRRHRCGQTGTASAESAHRGEADAANERRLSRLVARYGSLDLLLLVELRYVQLDTSGGRAFLPDPDRARRVLGRHCRPIRLPGRHHRDRHRELRAALRCASPRAPDHRARLRAAFVRGQFSVPAFGHQKSPPLGVSFRFSRA